MIATGMVVTGAPVAQAATSVTLIAGKDIVDYGRAVWIYGRIDPAAAGESVEILDNNDKVLGSDVTDSDGKYAVQLTLRKSTGLRARAGLVESPVETVRVRALIRSHLTKVRLFGRARAWGRISPYQPGGGRVFVALMHNGRKTRGKWVRLREGRRYRASFRLRTPGSFRTKAYFNGSRHAPTTRMSNREKTSLPSLGVGARGIYVKLLEKRLRALAVHLPGVDRIYDYRTADAMRAFNKYRGRPRLGTVDSGTWKSLAWANRPRPRLWAAGRRVEVDQTRQLLLLIDDNRVTAIVHVSTGRNGYTHDGTYRVYRKLAGTSGGGLYHPSYFHGRRAVHGWPEVPIYPASHGCVRVPMWAAQWIHSRMPMGSLLSVYH